MIKIIFYNSNIIVIFNYVNILKNTVCDNNDNNVDKKIIYNINIIVIFKYVHILKNYVSDDVETIYCHKEMLSLFYNCLSDLRTVLVSQ